jgi:hypothetical protein
MLGQHALLDGVRAKARPVALVGMLLEFRRRQRVVSTHHLPVGVGHGAALQSPPIAQIDDARQQILFRRWGLGWTVVPAQHPRDAVEQIA